LGRFNGVRYGDRLGSRRTLGGDPEWLTLGQAAKYLGVAQSTIRKWSDQGRLPAFYTPGGHRRYRRSDLDAFLERSGPGGRGREGPLVLIVDDDAGLRGFVRASLELEGYTVREAGSAEEGLQQIDAEPPDLILLDVMMPKVDGWEMLSRLQERHGVGAIPVLMFSGKVDEQSVADAARRGAQGFIGKPFDPQQLIESAKQMLPV
jgi:excisionase family DNA binding protein